ncbi:hypothetical protein ASPCAL06652 [Aspergillus calidoustus]|uniref:Uncharacterized protein n=1 Tax=Aspergillus calidoustus TaxID=454130 RepID=A0A0U5G4Q7_ASPCI|nr:hypothetical protein ASPCAL06652 [Aspergillus calidoustus]
MSRFQGKVITVTDAASGIGYAIAQHLANLGARLSITDISTEGLATTAAELESIIGKENLSSQALNIADRPAVESWITSTITYFGRLDDSVNAADVNVKGMLNLVRVQLRYLTGAVERKEIETASVVVFGSAASVTGAPSLSVYTTILVGPIDTPTLRNVVSKERMKILSSAIPLGRIGTAKEVVGLVTYLLDENSGFTTGAVHNVDRGIPTA